MGATHAAPPHDAEGQEPADAKPLKRRALRYLLPVLLGPLAMIASAFYIIPSHWFEMRSENLYMVNVGYGLRLHNRLCQVLVYGDSGALVGVDPRIITQRTGLTACNIAEFQGVTLVSQTMPLDRFLANNPPPRYMIFMYSPQNLNVTADWSVYPVNEAISFRLEQMPGWRTAWLLARHPAQTMAWVEGGLHLALSRASVKPFPPEQVHWREAYNGQFRNVMAGPRTLCDKKDPRMPPDLKWIQHLRTTYSAHGAEVLIDATPTPDCDPNNPYIAEHLRGVVDDYPLPHLPLKAYTDEGVLHTNFYGAGLISNLLADQILARERARASAQGEDRRSGESRP